MGVLVRMVLQRLGLGLATLFVVSLIIFLAVEMLPGDLAQAILGQSATPDAVAAIRKEVGLDRPPVERYLDWVEGIAHGDFGRSLANQREISELIGIRLQNTVFLAALSAAVAVPLSLGLGILAAIHRNSLIDRAVNATTLIAISFPEFFVAYILTLFLAVKIRAFPSLSMIGPEIDFGERVYRSVLPALTLTFAVTAHMMRMTRAAIINLLALPYIEMARLKGAVPRRVIVLHALPNAIAPIVTVVALNLAYLITGIVVVEVVFVYPGLGQLLVDSVTKRDITVVQAACLIFAVTYILLNLIADLVSIISNPRLLHPK